ncbi:MAG: hypothetical protein ACLTWO_05745 [Blautia massiliensis (ex Durand et al. 2017)]
MTKEIVCRCCGRHFIGHHNTQFCVDCREERARQASARTWQRVKLEREKRKRELLGHPVSEFEIANIDIRLAKSAGKTIGSFQLWKLQYPEEYQRLLFKNGYQEVAGAVYKIPENKEGEEV